MRVAGAGVSEALSAGRDDNDDEDGGGGGAGCDGDCGRTGLDAAVAAAAGGGGGGGGAAGPDSSSGIIGDTIRSVGRDEGSGLLILFCDRDRDDRSATLGKQTTLRRFGTLIMI